MIKRYIPKSIKSLRHFFYAWYGAVKYGHPSEEMIVIGVTGTSGKSTTAYLLRQILEYSGLKVGSLSTIEFYVAGKQKINDQKMTMLGKMQIQKYLREMKQQGCDIAIVETTSEGRVQHRHRFINYDTIILTNLYPEHIESHGSFENYKQAKLDIFSYIAGLKRKMIAQKNIPKTAIVNGDIEYTQEFLSYPFDEKYTFGKKEINTLSVEGISVKADGLHFTIHDEDFFAPMYGEHNVMNILAAVSVAKNLGISWRTIQKAVAECKNVPGRIEFIAEAKEHGYDVMVDYAFEPKAMEALYHVVGLLQPKRVIHVAGATGGGRDKARREPLGKMIGEQSDIFIVTDEDPYDEDPQEIMSAVIKGAIAGGKKKEKDLFEILDRKEAIKKALEMAQPGDLVLITGKGSEQAMCLAGGKKIPWDDREIARKILREYHG